MAVPKSFKFNGKLNYLNGLSFYFSGHGQVISFYIDDVKTKKRKIKIIMHDDPNHGRAHVHLKDHKASFAINDGSLLAGNCDVETQKVVKKWIHRHKADLLDLWNVVKSGGCHVPKVKTIQRNRTFEDFGFKGEEPKNKTCIGKIIIWHEGDLVTDNGSNIITKVLCDGNLYVGLPSDYKEGSMMFESLKGKVQMKKW